MTRDEFLRSLKPGDRVGVSQRLPYIAIVLRVTATGQIVLRSQIGLGDEKRFGRTGREINASGERFPRPHLVPVEQLETTEEAK